MALPDESAADAVTPSHARPVTKTTSPGRKTVMTVGGML